MMTTSGGIPISRRGIYPLRLLGVQISQYAKVQFIVVARIALLPLLCLEDSCHLFLGIVAKSIKFAALFSARFYPIMEELAACEMKKYRPKRSRELGRLFLRFHKWRKERNSVDFTPSPETVRRITRFSYLSKISTFVRNSVGRHRISPTDEWIFSLWIIGTRVRYDMKS